MHEAYESDKAAESTLECEIVKLRIPSTYLKYIIKLIISLLQIFETFLINETIFFSK